VGVLAGIRRHSYELFLDEMSVFMLQDSRQIQRLREKYEQEVERYRDQERDIQAEATRDEDEVRLEQRRADRFDLGEVMLEAALVVCSITLLTRKRFFWGFGLVLGVAGLFIR
jgi:Domain of unknown function (DUF4337)